MPNLHMQYSDPVARRRDSAFDFFQMKLQMTTNFGGSPKDVLCLYHLSSGTGRLIGSKRELLLQLARCYIAS